MKVDRVKLASMIDHTLLGPDVSKEQVEELCQDAIRHKFAAVCVNPCYVSLAKEKLRDSSVKVCTVIGFPQGANIPQVKALEAKGAVDDGADELDMVINIAALKAGDYRTVLEEIRGVREAIAKVPRKITLKVILETPLLDEGQKVAGAILVAAAGADFIKTCTGFSGNATVEDVKLFKQTVKDKVKIKASGGIKDYETALKLVEAGADRIGTSWGVEVIESQK
jgi:deoxyribose-phosphate aldolase